VLDQEKGAANQCTDDDEHEHRANAEPNDTLPSCLAKARAAVRARVCSRVNEMLAFWTDLETHRLALCSTFPVRMFPYSALEYQ
jgi:hypothetical protein